MGVIVGVPSMRVVDCTLSTGLSVDVFSCSSNAIALSRMFIAALWSALSDHAQRLQSKRAWFRFPASTWPHLLHCWLVYDGVDHDDADAVCCGLVCGELLQLAE